MKLSEMVDDSSAPHDYDGGSGSQCDRNIKKLLPDNVLMHTFAHCFFIIFVII